MVMSLEFIVVIIFFVNILVYLDRGIIPGASEEFNSFISETGITENQNAFLGLLQSAFIIGYSVASIVFGHSSHYYSPFHLCTCGMALWVIAIIFSGLSYYTNTYTCLLLARMASGIGEAAFQISIPPWIAKYAPSHQRGMYLSLFFTAAPVGIALGFVYAASLATTYGWQYCFFIEATAMACFIPIIYSIAPLYPSQESLQIETNKIRNIDMMNSINSNINNDNTNSYINKTDDVNTTNQLITDLYMNSNDFQDPLINDITYHEDETNEFYGEYSTNNSLHDLLLPKPSFLQEMVILLTNPIYLCIVAGFAAQG